MGLGVGVLAQTVKVLLIHTTTVLWSGADTLFWTGAEKVSAMLVWVCVGVGVSECTVSYITVRTMNTVPVQYGRLLPGLPVNDGFVLLSR
jgi:hypothetical protein